MSASNYTPFAQTFFVDANQSPNGIFVVAVDVVFSARDDILPIFMQIRPTNNGIPSSYQIHPGATAVVFPQNVNIVSGSGADLPDLTDATNYTRFTFPAPVYLPPGEHALVLKTNSAFYNVFIAEMSEPILGSDRIVSEQPYVGSMFKSQNGSTWTPIQNQDLLFNIIRAVFTKNTSAVVQLDNVAPATANVPTDAFFVHAEDMGFGSTEIKYNYKSTEFGGSIAGAATAFMINRNYLPDIRQVVTTANGSFKILETLSTMSDMVTPVIDSRRTSLSAIEYLINNGELQNSNILITAPGYSFTNASNITVTISAPTREANAGGGTTATAAVANVYAGQITSIILTSAGSGYVENPTITISSGGGTNAAANIVSETSATGGNALARYISRKVVLEPGFDATDLTVYLTANKQSGADIQVYYKIMASDDPDQNFDNKTWVRMRPYNNFGVLAQNDDDYIEYIYRPTTALVVPATPIAYTSALVTYNNFKVFAIKIVLLSTSTINPPSLRDMRAIALA